MSPRLIVPLFSIVALLAVPASAQSRITSTGGTTPVLSLPAALVTPGTLTVGGNFTLPLTNARGAGATLLFKDSATAQSMYVASSDGLRAVQFLGGHAAVSDEAGTTATVYAVGAVASVGVNLTLSRGGGGASLALGTASATVAGGPLIVPSLSVTGAGIAQTGVAFASLGTPANGTLLFCTTCDPPTAGATATCTAAGAQTGALALRVNSAWKCIGA